MEVSSNIINGYGKNYNEALVSGILNLIDFLLENDSNAQGLKESLKRFGCGDKVKTMPAESEKKVVNISRADTTKAKDSMIRSVKTIKDEIFESLNRTPFLSRWQHPDQGHAAGHSWQHAQDILLRPDPPPAPEDPHQP